MKTLITSVILFASITAFLAFTPFPAPPAQWKVDKAHSAITFSIKHFFTPVNGRFHDFDGDFIFDPENLDASKVDFTIQVNSVDTEEAKRDKHLQSPDFFNAGQYPTMRFVSTRFKKKGKDSYVAYGNLTIRDKTKEIELPFNVLGVADHPMMKGSKVMGLQAEAKINRNDFGVGTGDWAATMVVGDEVNIQIALEAVTQ